MKYSKEKKQKIIANICKQIAIDGKPLRQILMQPKSISTETFYKWLQNDENLTKLYAHSCNERSELIFDQILEISDGKDDLYFVDKHGVKRVDTAGVQLKRVKIDSRKWVLSKLNPKKYSDKLQVDTTEFKEQPLFPDSGDD